MLNVHCICHRLALACGDANDEVSYIKIGSRGLHVATSVGRK